MIPLNRHNIELGNQFTLSLNMSVTCVLLSSKPFNLIEYDYASLAEYDEACVEHVHLFNFLGSELRSYHV